jgi:hypothetical protein
MQKKAISIINQKSLSKEENKIKFLESRLKSPNNVGKAPAEYIPLKDTEIENIKTQMIILPPSVVLENISNKKNITPIKKKGNITNLKIEMFLNKKRKNSSSLPKEVLESDGNKYSNSNINFNINNSNMSNYSDKSSFTNNTKDENNSALFSGKNNSNNNYLFNSRNDKNKNKYEYNKKNANDYNSSLKSKTLYDYYKTTTIKRSFVNKDNDKQNIKNKNILINKKVDLININDINYENLLKRLEEQNLILEKKINEIFDLKISKEENEKLI